MITIKRTVVRLKDNCRESRFSILEQTCRPLGQDHAARRTRSRSEINAEGISFIQFADMLLLQDSSVIPPARVLGVPLPIQPVSYNEQDGQQTECNQCSPTEELRGLVRILAQNRAVEKEHA